MVIDKRYSTLFEPIKIGPVTAKNRFYQVPHCTGLGHVRPQAEAATRAVKAEGGWAVVSTQEAEIHPTSDISPYAEHRIWDERDIPALRHWTDSVHQHGALAAIELAHNGSHASNLGSRATILAPSDTAIDFIQPRQARLIDKSDIRAFRHWHRQAAIRAKEAGFDIIYVYAGHRMTLLHQFLLPELNQRSDEYGGTLENRLRLTREVLQDTHEAVGDTCAVAFRFAVDEMRGTDGMQAAEEGRAVVEILAEVPDLWDVNVSDWANDSATTRFQPNDGYQNQYVDFVKGITSKPVVTVGRLSSPNLMISMVKKGVTDFIGAARPSIADPFLPNKIKEGRIDEIRECIGCNICVASDNLCTGIRCTQNPTMGEEWRRNWHPEFIAPREKEIDALVVGSGPAGLECALQLTRRGYNVTMAEARKEPGGRVISESALPGLAAWRRVADNRLYELRQKPNFQMYMESHLSSDDVIDLGISNVFVATGATWRTDFLGRSNRKALTVDASILSPDDIMKGTRPGPGPVLIYDDDQIYLAGVLAETLQTQGFDATLVTPASVISPWTEHTLEQSRVQTRLLSLGVTLITNHTFSGWGDGAADLQCVYSGTTQKIACATTIPVTERTRTTDLYDDLKTRGGLNHLELIGDAATPGLIADATFSGHLAARNFEADPEDINAELFQRELPAITT